MWRCVATVLVRECRTSLAAWSPAPGLAMPIPACGAKEVWGQVMTNGAYAHSPGVMLPSTLGHPPLRAWHCACS